MPGLYLLFGINFADILSLPFSSSSTAERKGSGWDEVGAAPSQLSVHELFFLLILSINEWWKPVQRGALLLRQTACVPQCDHVHTHILSLLTCRWAAEVSQGCITAQSWRQKLVVGRLLCFSFFFFFSNVSQVSQSSNLLSSQINQRRWWGVFHSCVKKRLLWLFFFWLLWWCKVLQFDLFFKDYSFWEKKNGIKQFSCLWNKKKCLLFFAVTEAQVPKFSEHMGQDAS